MSEKNNLKTHTYFNFDVIGLWLKIKKNAHCEKIHTAYAAVIYQTGPKMYISRFNQMWHEKPFS